MAVNAHTASSRQLAARCSTATGILMSAWLIRRRLLHPGLRARVPLYSIPLTMNYASICGNLMAAICDRRYGGERCQPECVFEQHNGLTPGVMQVKARPHVAKTVRDFCSPQHMQILPWLAYSLDTSPVDNVLDMVGWRLTHDPLPAASKDELLLLIQAIWNSLPQANIQNLLDSLPRRIGELIETRGRYTKY
ncbi:transposable element Tcb2 transposase [Trichonephila clavipes]|nr:transposable element Tcb2 transposase [Trichonephila clavipes]